MFVCIYIRLYVYIYILSYIYIIVTSCTLYIHIYTCLWTQHAHLEWPSGQSFITQMLLLPRMFRKRNLLKFRDLGFKTLGVVSKYLGRIFNLVAWQK